MHRSRTVYYFLCFVLLFAVLGGFIGDRAVFAAQESVGTTISLPPNQEQPPAEETLEVTSQYPVLEGKSGDSFDFDVGLLWKGSKHRSFELSATPPPRWTATIMPQYGGTEPIAAIGLDPGKDYPDRLKVTISPATGYTPEPGEYILKVEASSGTIKESIELKAIVTARYELFFYTQSGMLNTEVTAGENNHLAVMVVNTGTAPIENITFSSNKPSDWDITFNPKDIQSLEPNLTQEVDVIITPPRQTIAGDWPVTLYVNSTIVSESLEIRVTALTPTIWGWVGILIVLAIIAGLGIIFWRLGRR